MCLDSLLRFAISSLGERNNGAVTILDMMKIHGLELLECNLCCTHMDYGWADWRYLRVIMRLFL